MLKLKISILEKSNMKTDLHCRSCMATKKGRGFYRTRTKLSPEKKMIASSLKHYELYCTKCDNIKNENDFYFSKPTVCKSCCQEFNKKARAKKKEANPKPRRKSGWIKFENTKLVDDKKRCNRCGEIKLAHEFIKEKNNKDKLSNSCKDCLNIRRGRQRANTAFNKPYTDHSSPFDDKLVQEVNKDSHIRCTVCGNIDDGNYVRVYSKKGILFSICKTCKEENSNSDNLRIAQINVQQGYYQAQIK